MGCGCGNHKHTYPGYTNISGLDPQDWDSVPYVLGRDQCGNLVILKKPEYELTEEDREKLDMLINDGGGNLYLADNGEYQAITIGQITGIETTGDGTRFLADDGNYRAIDRNSVAPVTLDYRPLSSNFVITNLDRLNDILQIIQAGNEAFVRLSINGVVIPLQVATSEEYISFLFDSIIDPIPSLSRSINDAKSRFNILIRLSTDGTFEPFAYEFRIIPDASTLLETSGDGTEALFNDGFYKPVYTQAEVDEKIQNVEVDLSGYYTKDEADEAISEALTDAVMYENNDIKARNNIILKNDCKLLGTRLDGAQINLIECSRFSDENHPIVDTGSASSHYNITSIDRPTVQLAGETGAQAHDVAFLGDVTDLETNLQEQIDTVSEALDSHVEEYEQFRDTTNAAFNTVNEAITNLDNQITINEGNIAQNTSDIEGIRQDLANTEHFRGYYLTTIEVTQISDPKNGDFAYNAETGTKWIYNGTTWTDAGTPIPDQSVSAYDGTPLENGTPSPGFTNEYSRGDHRHPSDTSKADIADLYNYIPLAGNSQTDRVTGDIWMSTGVNLRVTDSGNSYIGQETDTQTTVVNGAGAGGVDLRSELGTIKAQGQRVVTVGVNDNVQISSPIIQLNATGDTPVGLSMVSGSFQLAAGSILANLTGLAGATINSTNGNIVLNPTTNKLFYGSPDIALNEVAKLSTIEAAKADVIDQLTGIYVEKSGDTMTGNLNLSQGNVTIAGNYSYRFNGDGSVRMGYNTTDQRLEVVATTTANGVNVSTNPSEPNSLFTYNGNEVATKADIPVHALKHFEQDIQNSNVITLPEVPIAVVSVVIERLTLYPSEWEITGSAITIDSEEIDFTFQNHVYVTYLI